jgi:glycerophosphoryl diester phosphodiesterase
MVHIIAHRGASATAPENTLAAFSRAIDQGADGIEFDVRLAKDGMPVVIHDATLLRTAGIDEPVATRTSDELSRIDVGSWFNAAYPERSSEDYGSERIASLRTVLKQFENIRGPIYIELKCEVDEDVSSLVDAVCREIAGSPLRDQIIVKSFRLEVIPRTRAALPDIKTAALFAPKVMRLLRKEKYLIKIARELGADHLSIHKSLVSAKLIRKAARSGMQVAIWTVDSKRWSPWSEKHGLFALITNDPSKMLAGRELRRGRQYG